MKDCNWENILNVRDKYNVNVCSPVFDKKTVRMRAEKTPNFLLTFIIHDLWGVFNLPKTSSLAR